MELGEFIDGQTLTYDERSGAFALDSTLTSVDQVRSYAATGQIVWLSLDYSRWFSSAFPESMRITPLAAPELAQATPVTKNTPAADTAQSQRSYAGMNTLQLRKLAKEDKALRARKAREDGEERTNSGDHSMGGFFAACVAEGLTFLFVRNQAEGLGRVASYALAGLFAYFAYLTYRKSEEQQTVLGDGGEIWSTTEIWVGFLAALVAMWAPALVEGVLFIFRR